MSLKPLIGITANTTGTGLYDGLAQCGRGYIDAVAQAGGVPVALPPLIGTPPEALAALCRRLDGILFSGGRDLSPGRYGQAPHPASEPLDSRRDAWDMGLLDAALACPELPILGICLGIQELNVALGGSLLQHVPDRGSPIEHRAPETGDRLHAVRVLPGSQLARIVQADVIEVTTRHHQAVDRVGTGLVVSAQADDGLVEAVEGSPPGRFLIGVQWHPERNPEAPASRALFDAFVAACASRGLCGVALQAAGQAR